jgi:ATP-dependent DNA helicase Rep
MTIKLARLLEEDVKVPQRLACITYSNACLGEIRGRLKRLGVTEDGRLHLATVHSFCLTQLVLPYARLAGLGVRDPIVVSSPTQSRQLFERAHLETLGSPAPRWFRTECDRLRRTIVDQNSEEWKSWNGFEPPVVEAYQRLLLDNGMIDSRELSSPLCASLRAMNGFSGASGQNIRPSSSTSTRFSACRCTG